jgi:hypothetical protein
LLLSSKVRRAAIWGFSYHADGNHITYYRA